MFLFMHFCCVVRFGLAPLCGWNLLHPNVPSGPDFFVFFPFTAAVDVSERLTLVSVRGTASYDTGVCSTVGFVWLVPSSVSWLLLSCGLGQDDFGQKESPEFSLSENVIFEFDFCKTY